MITRPYYPVGIQDFSEMRRLNAVYVDKTDIIYRLTHTSKSVFLGRPRRFGKSLLCSTLQYYFEGRKDLFTGLAMEQLETEWTKHPVFHFNLSTAKDLPLDGMIKNISFQLSKYEKQYCSEFTDSSLGTRLSSLIMQANSKTGQQVVVIIDEYDAPILNRLHKSEEIADVRTALREFFAPLKAYDKYVRFVFLTGISTFSQLSIFSELNNLNVISNVDEYASICGITEQELIDNFQYGINEFAEKWKCSAEAVVDRLKNEYMTGTISAENLLIFTTRLVCSMLFKITILTVFGLAPAPHLF